MGRMITDRELNGLPAGSCVRCIHAPSNYYAQATVFFVIGHNAEGLKEAKLHPDRDADPELSNYTCPSWSMAAIWTFEILSIPDTCTTLNPGA